MQPPSQYYRPPTPKADQLCTAQAMPPLSFQVPAPPPPPVGMQKRSKAHPPQPQPPEKKAKACPQTEEAKARPWRRPPTEETKRCWVEGDCSTCHTYAPIGKGLAYGTDQDWEGQMLEIEDKCRSPLFCGPCLAEHKAGLVLCSFPPELHAYRKRTFCEDMPTFPEDYGISKLRNVNYVFPYKPHTFYPSDREMLEKLRNDPSYKWSPQTLETAAQAVKHVSWICNVDNEESLNDGWSYESAAEDGWLSTEALHKAGFNREDRSHRDINFEIHSG